MRKTVCFLLVIVLCFSLVSCGKPKTINGVTYDTCGLLNSDEKKNPNIEYEVCWGNVIWGCILIETLVAPIYFFGFALFNPVRVKNPSRIIGAI